jgi:hypothetical protein
MRKLLYRPDPSVVDFLLRQVSEPSAAFDIVLRSDFLQAELKFGVFDFANCGTRALRWERRRGREEKDERSF